MPAFAEAEEAHVDAVSGCDVPAKNPVYDFCLQKKISLSYLSKGRCPHRCATELMHQTKCRPIMYLKIFPFHATTKDSPIEQAQTIGSTKFINNARGMYHLNEKTKVVSPGHLLFLSLHKRRLFGQGTF